eukprot:Rmarinus@m.21039
MNNYSIRLSFKTEPSIERALALVRTHFDLSPEVRLSKHVLLRLLEGRAFDWGEGPKVYYSKYRPGDKMSILNDAVNCVFYERKSNHKPGSACAVRRSHTVPPAPVISTPPPPLAIRAKSSGRPASPSSPSSPLSPDHVRKESLPLSVDLPHERMSFLPPDVNPDPHPHSHSHPHPAHHLTATRPSEARAPAPSPNKSAFAPALKKPGYGGKGSTLARRGFERRKGDVHGGRQEKPTRVEKELQQAVAHISEILSEHVEEQRHLDSRVAKRIGYLLEERSMSASPSHRHSGGCRVELPAVKTPTSPMSRRRTQRSSTDVLSPC